MRKSRSPWRKWERLWSKPLRRVHLRLRSPRWIGMAAALGVAACVSLSSPRGGRGGPGNVSVVRGPYKSGADQQVRIALETSAKSGTISGTASWGLVHGDVG